MRKLPKVSVVIVTYNQEDFMAETIESVLNQTYKNIEIIIADDGSKDNTPTIIEKYARKHPNIKPILAKENKGIAYNFNRALKMVKGKYVALLGGDDLMLPHKIEKQVDYFNRNPDVVGVAHDMEVFDSSTEKMLGKFSEVISSKRVKGKVGVKLFFDPAVYLCPSAMIYKKKYIPAHGYDTRLKYGNDYLFDIEILRRGKLGYMDEILGKYRRHSRNVTDSSDIKKIRFEELLVTLSVVIVRYPELYKLVKKRREAAYLSEVIISIKNGDRTKAKKFSKILISEGSYIKGIFAYILSKTLSRGLVNRVYNSKYKRRFRDSWRRFFN